MHHEVYDNSKSLSAPPDLLGEKTHICQVPDTTIKGALLFVPGRDALERCLSKPKGCRLNPP